MRITARQQERERGLAAVGAAPRGYIVSVDGAVVGRVGYARSMKGESLGCWFWYGGNEALAIPRRNTAGEKDGCFATREAARDACVAYVKASLALAGKTRTP